MMLLLLSSSALGRVGGISCANVQSQQQLLAPAFYSRLQRFHQMSAAGRLRRRQPGRNDKRPSLSPECYGNQSSSSLNASSSSTTTKRSAAKGPFSCYLLRSLSSNRTYVGVTNSLQRRLREHNGDLKGGARATRSGRPWKLALSVDGFERYVNVLQFEWKWKHPRPRRFLFKGRMATLARLLRMDTWTKAAPASEIKLTVSLHDSDVAEEARALLEPNTLPPYVCIGETPGRPATTPAEGELERRNKLQSPTASQQSSCE